MKNTLITIGCILLFTVLCAGGFILGYHKELKPEGKDMLNKAASAAREALLVDAQEDAKDKINAISEKDVKLICNKNNHYLYLVDSDYFKGIDKNAKVVVGLYQEKDLYYTYELNDYIEGVTELNDNCGVVEESFPFEVH